MFISIKMYIVFWDAYTFLERLHCYGTHTLLCGACPKLDPKFYNNFMLLDSNRVFFKSK